MLKSFISWIYGIFLLLNINLLTLNASAIIVQGEDLSQNDKTKIWKTLCDFTGPSATIFKDNPELIKNAAFKILFSDEPFAETIFMRQYLTKEFTNKKIDVLSIPITVWDLYVAKEYITNDQIKDYYILLKRNNELKNNIQVFFNISKMIFSDLIKIGEYKLENYKKLAFNYLEFIKNSGKDNFRLSNEHTKIHNQQNSILMTMIDEEYLAGSQNKILLIRATQGVNLYEDLDKYKKCLKEEASRKYPIRTTFSLEEQQEAVHKQEEYINHNSSLDSIGYYGDPNEKILDFTLQVSSLSQIISDIAESKSNIDFFVTGKNLSYGTSILAGLLFDSVNRPQGACTFIYAIDPLYTVYTMNLEKKWLYTIGKSIFHFPKASLLNEGIFGSQETFHPRLKAVSVDFPHDYYHTVPTNIINLGEDNPYKDVRFKKAEKSTQENDYNILLQYVLYTTQLILEEARIVSMKGQIFTPNETSDAKQLLKNQALTLENLLKNLAS